MTRELIERIDNYLANGGLFNPELMEHDKVRELLIDCRVVIARAYLRTARFHRPLSELNAGPKGFDKP